MIVDLQVNLETGEGTDIDPEALIQGAKRAGLDGLVLTKEGVLDFDIAPYQTMGEAEGIAVFGGTKIASNHGLILCILPEGITLSEDFASQEDGVYDAHAVVESVEELGGVTVALRPYDRDVAHPMGDHLFSLQGLTACEVQSGQLSEIANDLALEAASNMEMPCIGTSGAQGNEGLGTAATLLRSPAKTRQDLCELLRHGDCWPVTFSDEMPQVAEPERNRRGRNNNNNNNNRRRGRNQDDTRGHSGGRRREPGAGRSNDTSRGGGGEGDRRRKRRRGGRGRPGGGGGKRPDDIGNRAPNPQRPVPEDIGNRIMPDAENHVDDGIGNRLAPGESSPYYRPQAEVFDDDPDDTHGNE